jgi:hypothetical protein
MTRLLSLHYIGAGSVPVRSANATLVLVAVAAFIPYTVVAIEKSALAIRRVLPG